MQSEEETLKKSDKKEEEEQPPPSLGGLKRLHSEYGEGVTLYLVLGIIAASLNGLVMPFFAIIFREILDMLNDWYEDRQDGEKNSLRQESILCLTYFISMGTASCIFHIFQYSLWGVYGAQITVRVREAYFRTLLRQEIGYHESATSSKLNTRLNTDCAAIQEGLSTKMGFLAQNISQFVFGVIIAFVYSWELTLILLATVPVLMLVGWIQGKWYTGAQGAHVDKFSENAGPVSQEVLTNLRIVLAFPNLVNIKKREYNNTLESVAPKEFTVRKATGFSVAFYMFALFAIMYPAALYFGSRLIDDDVITVGEMFGAYFALFIGGVAVGQLGSVTGDIQKANIAANRFFELFERKPEIRDADKTPIQSGRIEGYIEFRDVSFSYPSNPEKLVLRDVSFSVRPGESLAIVGPSGSGKSTIVALLERYYDPNSGEILIDDQPIHNYDPDFLRNQMGLVSQMPLLFDSSITENIRGGQDCRQEQIVEAAKLANAHDFIMGALEQQYDTRVGELGGRLSGGQRQRIAIARAMLFDPAILLLDEATSALDTKSEIEVQTAIDRIQDTKTQTSITIAHRLSTIQNSDKIIVLVDGEIVEQGNHESLIANNDVYAILCKSQRLLEDKTVQHRADGAELGAALEMIRSHSGGSTKSGENEGGRVTMGNPTDSTSEGHVFEYDTNDGPKQ